MSVRDRPFTDGRPSKSAVSWLPKHKRADPTDGGIEAATDRMEIDGRSERTRLATTPGIELREEATFKTGAGSSRAKSWAATTTEWRKWLADVKATSAVFEGENVATGETDEQVVPLENRFMESRQKQLYAKLHDLERGVRDDFENLNTAMLTFTASNRSGAGDWWRSPGNHLDDLMGSWSAVRRSLHRVLDGRRWEYARILEPHKSGYVHVHLAVFVDGYVRPETFESVMDAHVDHCLPAGSEAHSVDSDAVSIRRDVSNVAAYLSSYVMKYGEEALEAPEHVQRFNALLWATGTRRWSVSNGAQEYMAFEGPEMATDWQYELTHVEVGEDRYPVERGGGDVLKLALPPDGAGLDPPPELT